jgi:pimeloyl-ACP methyl ester carboxylesterase
MHPFLRLALVAASVFVLAAPSGDGGEQSVSQPAAATKQAEAAAPAVASANAGLQIAMQEMMVPSPQQGLQIYVRNKHPLGTEQFGPERTLVFVHGATYPASTTFDLALNGLSWMDYIAAHGYDVYLLDLPGYGRSSRPPQMDQPPEANPPFETTEQAVADLGAVIERIRTMRGIASLDVMGWSWGTTIAAGFATAHPEQVNRLVLYAPLWVFQGPPAISAGPGKLGAYRSVSREAAFKRWMNGVPVEARADLIPPGWFEQWADTTFATDPVGAKQSPPVLRAPNGVLWDVERFWRAGKPTWDAAKLAVPVLLVQGEWDHDTPPPMAQALFAAITHAPYKQYTMIGGGTHTLVMERNRMLLFEVVQSFLDAPPPR